MEFQKILAIAGKPGLFELVAQMRSGFVAKSLTDGKKTTVNGHHNVTVLADIAVYSYTEEVRLADVFKNIAIKEQDGQAISHKENDTVLRAYFREVLPEYDEDRVYVSDIKKILNWYNALQKTGLVTKEALEKLQVELQEQNENPAE